MSKHDGKNYEPIDLNKGIALECERDEFGHFTHTLWVDSEIYQITENAWEKLMRFNFERFDEGKQTEQERIIKLLWNWGMDNLDCQSQYEDLVDLIKRSSNEKG